jgi:Surface-adhesin protein E
LIDPANSFSGMTSKRERVRSRGIPRVLCSDIFSAFRSVFFLITLLVLSNGPAYAEWKLFTTDGKGNTVYTDPDTILRKGNLVKIWVLIDSNTVHETIEGVSFLSSRTLHQYDCEKGRFRFLAFALFSGNMGSGQMVHSNHHVLEWEPVPPKGAGPRLLKWVCKK